MRKKSKTAGKTAHILSYRREQLIKFGIKDYEDMLRVLNPQDYTFDFETENVSVIVEPAEQVLPPEAFHELLVLLDDFPMLMGQCHMNAFKVSSCLKSFGVLYCDGTYTDWSGKTYYHSFCKYEGRYFDPTIEFGFLSPGICEYSYFSSRVFDPHEIHVYFATSSLMNFHFQGSITSTPTTLDFDFQEGDEAPFCQLIDDSGCYKWVDNPYYSTISR